VSWTSNQEQKLSQPSIPDPRRQNAGGRLQIAARGATDVRAATPRVQVSPDFADPVPLSIRHEGMAGHDIRKWLWGKRVDVRESTSWFPSVIGHLRNSRGG